MQLSPNDMQTGDIYRTMVAAITPRPIAWVSTISNDGIHNLAPFSFFNGVTAKPASLVFSPVNRPDGSEKDTVVNINANRQFVVNVVPYALVEQMHLSAAEHEPEVSEFEAVGLTPVDSVKIAPARVAEAPIQFECELIQTVTIGEGGFAANLIIGEIVMIHIDDKICNEKNKSMK